MNADRQTPHDGGYVLGGQSVREVLPAMGHSVNIGVDVRTSGLVPRPRWEMHCW